MVKGIPWTASFATDLGAETREAVAKVETIIALNQHQPLLTIIVIGFIMALHASLLDDQCKSMTRFTTKMITQGAKHLPTCGASVSHRARKEPLTMTPCRSELPNPGINTSKTPGNATRFSCEPRGIIAGAAGMDGPHCAAKEHRLAQGTLRCAGVVVHAPELFNLSIAHKE